PRPSERVSRASISAIGRPAMHKPANGCMNDSDEMHTVGERLPSPSLDPEPPSERAEGHHAQLHRRTTYKTLKNTTRRRCHDREEHAKPRIKEIGRVLGEL